MSKRNEYIPQTVTHPGLTLREKLVELLEMIGSGLVGPHLKIAISVIVINALG